MDDGNNNNDNDNGITSIDNAAIDDKANINFPPLLAPAPVPALTAPALTAPATCAAICISSSHKKLQGLFSIGMYMWTTSEVLYKAISVGADGSKSPSPCS